MKCPNCNAEFEIEWKTDEEINNSLAEQRDIDLEECSLNANKEKGQ